MSHDQQQDATDRRDDASALAAAGGTNYKVLGEKGATDRGALTAIQGLAERLEDTREELADRNDRIEDLEQATDRIDDLEADDEAPNLSYADASFDAGKER